MSLHFITGNQGKLKEVQSILGDVVALDIDLVEIQSLDAHEIIRAKLEEARKHHKGKLIVEDTSLYFDGLNGLPGPLIKWFMKSIGNDGLMKIVQNLDNNRAEAKTVIGYSNASGEVSFFEGSVFGTIVTPRGTGFGWDPIFMPDGQTKTFGEMTAEEKNSLSMRRLAVEKLREFLVNN
jgi:non-canonical purine NTP pyrophosphatase (RdgB/HAM1 family)